MTARMEMVGTEPVRSGRTRRAFRRAGAVVVIALFAGAAGWALRTVVTPPPDVLDAAPYSITEAVEGTVGQSISLNAVASWKIQRSVANQADGMVTSIEAAAGSRVEAGGVLYRVALRPVVVGEGDTPAFRDISSGDRGDDVRQFQQMLADLGRYDGEIDGVAGQYTVQAIRAWQRDLGVEPDGVVRLGDVLFLPTMPAIVSYTDLAVGQAVSPGLGTVDVLGSAPEFTVSLTETQARLVSPGTPVRLSHGETQWEAQVEEVAPASEDAPAMATLASTGDGPICGDDCGNLPVTVDSTVPSQVVVVPAQTGVAVPAAALTSGQDEETVVVSADGTVIPVEVVASARGQAVVEGLKLGTQVRVPGVLPTNEEESG